MHAYMYVCVYVCLWFFRLWFFLNRFPPDVSIGCVQPRSCAHQMPFVRLVPFFRSCAVHPRCIDHQLGQGNEQSEEYGGAIDGDESASQHDYCPWRWHGQPLENSGSCGGRKFECVSLLMLWFAGGHMPVIVLFSDPGRMGALQERSSHSNVKLEALSLVQTLLQFHEPALFGPFYDTLSASVFKCVEDSYPKTMADALFVCQSLVNLVTAGGNSAERNHLFNVILSRLRMTDVNQVWCSFSCCARLVYLWLCVAFVSVWLCMYMFVIVWSLCLCLCLCL